MGRNKHKYSRSDGSYILHLSKGFTGVSDWNNRDILLAGGPSILPYVLTQIRCAFQRTALLVFAAAQIALCGHVEVTVTDASGNAMSGVVIRAQRTGDESRRTLLTNAAGRAWDDDLPDGSYRVYIAGPSGEVIGDPADFSLTGQQIAVVNFTDGGRGKVYTSSSPFTQPDIQKDCVLVTGISSLSPGVSSGPGAPGPELVATVTNKCANAAALFLWMGYFDLSGKQFGDGLESITVPSGAHRTVHHVAQIDGPRRGQPAVVRIFSVETVP